MCAPRGARDAGSRTRGFGGRWEDFTREYRQAERMREREKERGRGEVRIGYPCKKRESGEHREGDPGLTREDGKRQAACPCRRQDGLVAD